jgi:cytochrome c biogenesis factor
MREKRDIALVLGLVAVLAVAAFVFLGTQPPSILSYISGNP